MRKDRKDDMGMDRNSDNWPMPAREPVAKQGGSGGYADDKELRRLERIHEQSRTK
jgi:hypothetical protein